MTKIIWVRGGLVNNARLSEAIEQIPERECLIVKVQSVQEAIVELYEGDGETALIICDKVLDMSIPQSELHLIAETQNIPYLVNEEDGVYTDAPIEPMANVVGKVQNMYETQRFKTKRRNFMHSFLSNLHVHRLDAKETLEHMQAL